MKTWVHIFIVFLLVSCSDEPKVTKFRGIHLGQTLEEMNAALAEEQTGMNARTEGEPNEIEIIKTETSEFCGYRFYLPQGLESGWLALYPCFFDLPERMSLEDFKSHIVSITGVDLHHEAGEFVGISPFGERILVTSGPYVMIRFR